MATKPTTKPTPKPTVRRAAAAAAEAEPKQEPVAAPAPAPTPAPGWHAIEDLRREVDRLFVEFIRGNWLSTIRPPAINLEPIFGRWFAAGAPAVDVVEKDKAYEIMVELPGLDENNVEVIIRDGNLVISGERQKETEETAKGYQIRERQFGSFQRTLAIPQGVDAGRVEASFKNGVLTLTMPKTRAPAPEKKIRIKPAQ